MSHTEKWKELPDHCEDPHKRKRGRRGRVAKKNKKLRRFSKLPLADSSSDSSPMKKVVFDLTAFSSDDETIELREKTPPPSSDESESDTDGEK